MMTDDIKSIIEKFPFLTYATLLDKQYIGIVQNSDSQLISMYILDSIPPGLARKEFLRCGDEWWWGSNRQIPINIFLKERFKPFRMCLKHFARKEFNIEAGPPLVSLQDTITKRVRKRQINLIKKID